MTTTIYDAERRDISIAVGGDAMITRRMQAFQEPRFLRLVDIMRQADVSLVNLEMLFHDYESSWQWSSATYTRSDPKNLDELKWMGINAVTTANNHSFDFSEGGFLTTLEHCRDVDLPHAGGGRNLDEARAPAYVDSARGRVAVMSATSTFSETSRAGAGRPDFPGRPGVNALRHDITHHVQQDVFDALHKANLELGYEEEHAFMRHFGFRGDDSGPDAGSELDFLDHKFILDETFAVRTALNEEDRLGIGNWIRGAQKQSDWQVYGVHCHESGPEGDFHGHSRISPPTSWWTLPAGPSTRAAPPSWATAPTSCAASRSTRTGPSSIAWATLSSRTKASCGCPTSPTAASAWTSTARPGITWTRAPAAAPAPSPPTPCSGRAW